MNTYLPTILDGGKADQREGTCEGEDERETSSVHLKVQERYHIVLKHLNFQAYQIHFKRKKIKTERVRNHLRGELL